MSEPPFSEPSAAQSVAELLRAWPQTMAVFLRRRMACPGCAMAPFMTVAEAAGAYGVPIAALLAEFTQVIAGEVAWGPFLPPLPHGPVEQSSEG